MKGGGWALHIRLGCATLLVLLAAIVWQRGPVVDRLQSAWFDAHQALWPRQVQTLPVTIVAIDQKSLLEIGQWPWPRNVLARLVRIVQRAEPAAIGLNILMPEPDALSPERLLAQAQVEDRMLAEALRALPTHDAQLARALAGAPSVLVVAGMQEPTPHALRAAPVAVRAAAGGAAPAELPALPTYAGALTSIDELDKQATGWGLISAESTRGLIRRMPTVASIDGTLLPALAVEMLRVAQRAPALSLRVDAQGVDSVGIGRLNLPTEGDGSVRLYFSRHMPQRFVSAVDVLDGHVRESELRGQLVLIGLTGVALQEVQNTPIGERMSGTEIHAQLLENILQGTLLQRPRWAPALEAGLLLAAGVLLLWAMPRWRTSRSLLLLAGCIAVPMALGLAAFQARQLLFDTLTPALCLLLFFGVLLALTEAAATQQARALEKVLQTQREAGARIAGELQAAQRVQEATLPADDLLRADPRVALHATLHPAREVGGDLYDYFMLDGQRLFLLVGDVAGKGLLASIFMAVSKALYKSAMLRAPDADIGTVMAQANAEVSRDNPGNLFVTCFAAILDLDRGELHYCNAGHDNPYLLKAGRSGLERIADGDGPPLCAVPDFDYRGARCTLQPGETLCLMTDGVTEAQTPRGELFGNARLQTLLLALQQRDAGVHELVETLRTEVQAFAEGGEQADDLTILALRWHGPQPGAVA